MKTILKSILLLVVMLAFVGQMAVALTGNSDSANTNKNVPVVINVLTNDLKTNTSDLTETLNVVSATTPAHGTALINSDKTITYTPSADYIGPDVFTYTLSNGVESVMGVTVSLTINQVNTISSDEQDYNDLKDQLSGYDDDYFSFKRKYERAQDDNDLGELKRYEEKLQDLDDDLINLFEDARDLENEVEDNSPVDRALLDNVEELQDDIETLQDKISRLLDDDSQNLVSQWSDQTASGQTTAPVKTTTSTAASDKPFKVVYEKLELPALTTANVPAASNTVALESLELSSTEQNYALTILIGGVVIVLAVIIFLLASLLKR